MTLPYYSSTGQKQTSTYKIKEPIFSIKKINHNLLKQVYVAQLANRRLNLAKTKTRREVRGGGRKPHRQKGLGLARAGSIRSPLMRGGGITFGPTGSENYTHKINKKVKYIALLHALSLKKSKMIVVKSLPDDGKTAKLHQLLYQKLKLDRKILIIADDLSIKLKRASRNLPEVELIRFDQLNLGQVLDFDQLVWLDQALDNLADKLRKQGALRTDA
ncbi:MAG: 50S ribosomal protein L4 [Candidatus Saccharibacteria bacterium]|nr:50S ribosomal protein L4 [Candidatus Saccharibacteria bacterium]